MSDDKKTNRNEDLKSINDLDDLMKDDFNIKSELNNSLDLHKITVSEDLISRTLEAVRKQEEEQPAGGNKELHRSKDGRSASKVNKAVWYRNIRMIAGTAAAVIVLVAGFTLISTHGMYLPNNGKGSTGAPIAQESADTAAAGSDSSSGIAKDSLGTTNGSNLQDSGTGAAAKTFAFDGGTEDGKTKDDESLTASNQQAGVKPNMKMANAEKDDKDLQKEAPAAATPRESNSNVAEDQLDKVQGIASILGAEKDMTFQDIVSVPGEEISSIKMTDNFSEKEITLTQQEDIEKFYTELNQLHFTAGTQTTTTTIHYTIIITDTQGTANTLKIADVVTVNPIAEDVTGSAIYAPVDKGSLVKLISGYLRE